MLVAVPPLLITSRHNPRFRAALALREARERRASGRMLIDGAREIGRALAAGVHAVEAYVTSDFEASRTEEAAILAELRARRVELVEVSPELGARLSYGDRDAGVVVVAETPSTDLGRLSVRPEALVAVVEGVEKPGNLGAILRSADGAGVDAVLVADPRTDPWNPNCVRASLGTVFSVPLAVATGDEVRAWLAARGSRVVVTRVDAARRYTAADLTGEVAIVLGSEAAGLGTAWSGPGVEAVSIPMLGAADSLNVAATAAVLFYEALRQRTAASGS
jgi:TrmH family RNA methyltransferase